MQLIPSPIANPPLVRRINWMLSTRATALVTARRSSDFVKLGRVGPASRPSPDGRKHFAQFFVH